MSDSTRQEDKGAAVSIETPHGQHVIYLTGPELKKYPTKEARGAAYFGMSENQYREWLSLAGNALCAGRRNDGQRCEAVISGCNSAEIWLAIHRKCHCDKHRPEPKLVMSALEKWLEELRGEFRRDDFMSQHDAAEAVNHEAWHEWFRRGFTPQQAVAGEKEAQKFWDRIDPDELVEAAKYNPELIDILKAAFAKTHPGGTRN